MQGRQSWTRAPERLHGSVYVGLETGTTWRGAVTTRLSPTSSHFGPHVAVQTHAVRLTEKNAAALFAQYDLIADGSDNFATRFLVNDTAFATGKTLVSAAVTEFDGQLATFKAHDGVSPCYRCLFSAPPPPGTVANCSETGVLGAAAGVMGSLQALEVLKEITGIGTSLAGRLLIYEALTARFRLIAVPRDTACSLHGL